MWTALSALAAIVTAVVAIVSIRKQTEIAKGNSRPYVVPRLELNSRSHHIEFVIKNYGTSAALDLDVRFGDEVSHKEPTMNDLGAYLSDALSSRIPVFAPNQEWRTIVKLKHKEEDEVPIPDEFDVFVSYVGPDRRVRYGKDVDELPFRLSAKHFDRMLYIGRSDHDVEQRINKLTRSVDRRGKESAQQLRRVGDLIESAVDPEAVADRKQQAIDSLQALERRNDSFRAKSQSQGELEDN